MKRSFVNKIGFTLMEVLITVSVVAVITAFAIPQFTKSMDRSEERKLLLDMTTIQSAQAVYKARYGDYWPPVDLGGPLPVSVSDITELNTALGLNIVQGSKEAYTCMRPAFDPATYICTSMYITTPSQVRSGGRGGPTTIPARGWGFNIGPGPVEVGVNPSCRAGRGGCPTVVNH